MFVAMCNEFSSSFFPPPPPSSPPPPPPPPLPLPLSKKD